MKIPKIIIAISIAVIFLSSCSFFQKREPFPIVAPTETQLQKKIGIVEMPTLDQRLKASSKFTLLTETGERIFLDSASINLKKYSRRRVEIEGRWDDGRTTFLVENITSLGKETQIKTAYQNQLFGMKFQYPSIWELRESKAGDLIHITPYEIDESEKDSIDTIAIERFENPDGLSATEWLQLDELYRPKDAVKNSAIIYQKSAIGLGLIDAVKKTEADGKTVTFYAVRDKFIYSFFHTIVSDADKDLYRNVFYEIVASFEFIPFTQATGTSSPQQ